MKQLIKYILFSMTICFCQFTLFAQQNKIDSLLTKIKTNKTDTNQLIQLNNISKEFESIGSYDSSIKYANSALQLGYLILKKYTDNIHKISVEKNTAISYNTIGLVNKNTGNYPEALKKYYSALKISEGIRDKKGIAESYYNIGILNWVQGNNDEALKNLFESLKIKKTIGDKKGIANVYNGIGAVYSDQKNYKEALNNILASLEIREIIVDKKGISICYNNIGFIYENQGDYPKALKNHFVSLKIKKIIGDKAGITRSYYNIGSIFTKQKLYNKAEKYLDSAKILAKEIGHKLYLRDTYKLLKTLDSSMNNFNGAFKNYKEYINYRDILKNEESNRKTMHSEMTFNFEKKEMVKQAEQDKKDIIANERLNQKEQQRNYFIVGFALLGLLVLFVFRGYKQKQKANITITQQKNEVEKQKNLVEEKQKEILDSITYAKRLQEAILPPVNFVNANLIDNFIYYQPKDIVAGDFYWAEKVGNKFFIAAADSTGHGVPGAMVSVVCSNALNRTIKEFKLTETGKILDKTRELVLETFEKSASEVKDGMDISLLCIDSKNKNIFWSGANNPLWYIQDSEFKEIKADKQPIGKSDYPKPFTTHQIEYKENTTFYLFTDGLADQFGGPNGKKFKYKQFSNLLIKNNNLSQKHQADIINKVFSDWKGELEQVDDVCVIGIKI